MPHITIKIIFIGGFWLFSSSVTAQTCKDSLMQLVGNWRDDSQDTVFIEQWTISEDKQLVGFAESRSKTEDKQYMSEKMVLEQRGNELIYIATVTNQNGPVEFRMVSCESDSIVFENPDHDFPKRIEYDFPEPDIMHAHVTDMNNKGFDLIFSRVD